MDIPDSLRHKIALFREAGRVFRYDEELFTKPSWVAVMVGQHITPRHVTRSSPHCLMLTFSAASNRCASP